MRFDIEVHWNPDGLLEGDVRPSGETTPTPFWGITELIGLLQTQLGPAPVATGPRDLVTWPPAGLGAVTGP